MPDNESSSSEVVQEVPVNCWQYSRDVYLIGRSLKYRYFTEDERAAVITFITEMAKTRPAYVPYINLKADNPPANEFVDAESSDESSSSEAVRELAWTYLEKQNDYSLAKMVQKIGRSLKVQFCTAEEKELCDALFIATDQRRFQTLNKYVDVVNSNEEVPQESSATEESSTVEESSAIEETSSESTQP